MILKLQALSCGYAGIPVLHHIDLQVDPGEILAVVGPNGVG